MAMIPKVLVLSGSDRAGSRNKKLAQAAMKTLAQMEAEVTMIALADFPLPLLGQDGDRERGLPDNAVKLAGMIAAHDALFVASPEYNASIPPALKNALDWASQVTSDGRSELLPFDNLAVALGCATDEPRGGVLVLDHLRAVFVRLGALVVSGQCIVVGDVGFDTDDMRRGPGLSDLTGACRALLDHSTAGRGR